LISTIENVGNFLLDSADLIAELDLNPVIVGRDGEGANVVDALIVIARSSGPKVGAPIENKCSPSGDGKVSAQSERYD